MLNETTLLHCGDITVTDARFMIGSQTFAIRGITSVQGIEVTPISSTSWSVGPPPS